MKRILDHSSSGSDDDDVFEAFGAKRKQDSSSDEEEKKHKQFKKVEVNLKNHVYEPVHFVRAHCGAGEIPEVNTQVKLFAHLPILAVLDGMSLNQILMACFQLDRIKMDVKKVWDAEVERGGKGRLATCGGAFLCVFATKSNQLLMRQEFYQLRSTEPNIQSAGILSQSQKWCSTASPGWRWKGRAI